MHPGPDFGFGTGLAAAFFAAAFFAAAFILAAGLLKTVRGVVEVSAGTGVNGAITASSPTAVELAAAAAGRLINAVVSRGVS